ncbi:MAG: ribosomal L7Ae/L30e/S12e/Gadd45 family protein [Candidatus Nanoarchaeia archaeon]
MASEIDKILKADKEKLLVKGFKETLKAAKLGNISNIYIAKTCPDVMKRKLQEVAELAKIKLIELPLTAEELSAQLKKPFNITVLAISSK